MCLNKEVQLAEIIEIIEEKLNAGGTVTFTPNGESMMPMLRDGEDAVVLKKPGGRLHLFDVPLYRRSNGQFVLHRVIDFGKDGSYVMCGDNQFAKERGITDAQIIGVVTAFYRKGKAYSNNSLRYRTYINFWYYTRPFRRVFRAVKRRWQRLFGIDPNKKSNKSPEQSTEKQ